MDTLATENLVFNKKAKTGKNCGINTVIISNNYQVIIGLLVSSIQCITSLLR